MLILGQQRANQRQVVRPDRRLGPVVQMGHADMNVAPHPQRIINARLTGHVLMVLGLRPVAPTTFRPTEKAELAGIVSLSR